MIERTTPVMPNNLAKNLVNPFPPVTFATVKKVNYLLFGIRLNKNYSNFLVSRNPYSVKLHQPPSTNIVILTDGLLT
jgi:hypothetical protein